MRLVSLLPSATEIVYALGLGDDLAGVTFECDEPPAARAEKKIVVSGRDTAGMTPGEIDSYVRSQLAAGEDLYTLHARALAGLAPDLILTQDLCRVCALPSGHVNEALDYLGCRADVLTLDPHSLAEVLASILAVCASSPCCLPRPRSCTRSAWVTTWSGSPSNVTSRPTPGPRRRSWWVAATPAG